MLTRDPDPNIQPISVVMYNGLQQYCNGTLRTRYDIPKELNAPEETQREMSNLIGYLMFVNLVIGMLLSTGMLVSVYLYFKLVI